LNSEPGRAAQALAPRDSEPKKYLQEIVVKKVEKTIQGHELRRMYPLYEAVDRFLFARAEATISAPHIRDAINLKRIAVIVVIALLPVIFMALYNTGLQANLALAELGRSSAAGWRGSVCWHLLALQRQTPAV